MCCVLMVLRAHRYSYFVGRQQFTVASAVISLGLNKKGDLVKFSQAKFLDVVHAHWCVLVRLLFGPSQNALSHSGVEKVVNCVWEKESL